MEGTYLIEIMFVVFLSSLFSLGGGNGPVAVIQDQYVQPGTLDPSLFTWSLALSHLTPGPKAGFLAGIGYYLYGFPGAFVALIGIVIPACLGSIGVSYGMSYLKSVIDRISVSAGFIIAGMIAAAAWRTVQPMSISGFEIIVVLMIAVLIAWRNIDPVYIILGAAGVGLLWSQFS